jgi:hypothetical protein
VPRRHPRIGRIPLLGRYIDLARRHRLVSGGLLVVAGAYVVYYGIDELRLASGGDTDDPVISAATSIKEPSPS